MNAEEWMAKNSEDKYKEERENIKLGNQVVGENIIKKEKTVEEQFNFSKTMKGLQCLNCKRIERYYPNRLKDIWIAKCDCGTFLIKNYVLQPKAIIREWTDKSYLKNRR